MKLRVIKPSANNNIARVFIRAAGLNSEEVEVYGRTRTESFLSKCPAHVTPLLEVEELPEGVL